MKSYKSIIIILIIFFKTGNVLSDVNIFNVNNIELVKKPNTSNEEMANQAMVVNTLNRVVEILDDFAQIDKQANLEGRRLSLILSPK